MHEHFIAYQPSIERPCSQQDPGLLFVFCDQRNGRTQEQNKARLRRHVMRRHLHHHDRDKTQSGVNSKDDSDSRNHEGSPLPDLERVMEQPVDTNEMCVSDPRAMVDDSMGPLSLPFKTDYDAKSVLKWTAAGHDSMQAERFRTASCFYLHGLWELASTDKLMLDGLALYACGKKIRLTGDSVPNQQEYLRRKGNLIKGIQRDLIKTEDPDSSTLFAMIVLASSSALESKAGEGAVHLAAIRSMRARQDSSLILWAYTWLTDLRIAFFTGKRHILEYNRLHEVEERSSLQGLVPLVRSEAMRLAPLCPKASGAFRLPQSVDIFSRLLRLCTISQKRVEDMTLPVREVYEIEYQIRNVHADVLDAPPSSTRTCVEIVILAIQLSVWIAARFFAPLTELSKSEVLHRASQLVMLLPPAELLIAWEKDSGADAHSLLWALALFSALLAGDEGESIPLAVLAYVANYLSLETESEFLSELHRWPPQNAWNASRYRGVWARLVEFRSEPQNREMLRRKDAGSVANRRQNAPRAEMPFFGPFEFWDL